MKISTVIWDWNGTLLDDLHLSLRIINQLLKKRSLPELSNDRYREVLTAMSQPAGCKPEP